MKQSKRKKIFGLLAILLVLGGVAGAMLWPQANQPDAAPVNRELETAAGGDVLPETQAARESAAPVTEPAPQLVLPAADELAYTFEGAKLYIVAGSVTVDGNGTLWQAKVKNVTAKGTSGPEQLVCFKRQGSDVMTRLDQGNWRTADDMDRSVYRRIMAIVSAR